ncbi:MAG TPA: hypothetical protein VEA41_09860 [Salinarimonas sp.]|nr:hypothetical protein [Salinarimonas sp.]
MSNRMDTDVEAEAGTAVMFHATSVDNLIYLIRQEMGGASSIDVGWIRDVPDARRAVVYELEQGGVLAVAVHAEDFRHLRTDVYPNG